MALRVRGRGLELPVQVRVNQETLTDTYGEFVAEPFERGFGVTIGNAIRRVLLSSLEGAAVSSIKITDAEHEFIHAVFPNTKRIFGKRTSGNKAFTTPEAISSPIVPPSLVIDLWYVIH